MKNTGSLSILLFLGLAHLFNDLFQSILSASYPVLADGLHLSFGQIGLISLVYQIFASVFQPLFGVLFDRYQSPWYLPLSTLSTMTGLLLLAFATSMNELLPAVAFMGLGSSMTHPEASRLTHFASEGKHGLAQSIFQVGGNFGGSIGPLLAAAIITPCGQRYIALFAIISLFALWSKWPIIRWQRHHVQLLRAPRAAAVRTTSNTHLSRRRILFSLLILLVLIFSKYVYLASISNFYTFYLIEKFGVTTQQSQLYLFAYLFAAAAGTFLGGPIGDRIGRKWVIWVSILGTAPFSLLLPHVGLAWTCVLSVVIGVVLSSAFSAILVYAQELMPKRVGMLSGLFFGLAFGIAGIAAAVLGDVADTRGIEYVYRLCAYMPLLGLVAAFLPNVKISGKK